MAVGGDYKKPAEANRVAIYSADGGETWQLAEKQPGGYRSAAASCAYDDFAAVGPNGTDVSHDKGKHWIHTDSLNLNALSFDGRQGWAVGAKGTIARFNNKYEYIIKNGNPERRPSAGARRENAR